MPMMVILTEKGYEKMYRLVSTWQSCKNTTLEQLHNKAKAQDIVSESSFKKFYPAHQSLRSDKVKPVKYATLDKLFRFLVKELESGADTQDSKLGELQPGDLQLNKDDYEERSDGTSSSGTDPQSSSEDDDPCSEPTEFAFPQGQVASNSNLYVERTPIEENCKKYIMQPGSLLRIRAPKQMGKTSLLSRILDRAEKQNYQTATIDFQMVDRSLMTNLDRFLQWFCLYVGRQLKLKPEEKIEDWWNSVLGSKVNAHDYFEQYILGEIDTPILLALDEVDRLFEEQIAEDFFALLRAWHEEAKRNQTWQRLRLVLVHSTEEYLPTNINQSPFNVGFPVELSEFTAEQVQDLAQCHQLQVSEDELNQLMDMVGGHPYLIRMALYELATHNSDADESEGDRDRSPLEILLKNAPTEAGIYRDHLRRHLSNLEENPNLATAMKQIVESESISLKSTIAYKLNSTGLTKQLEGDRVQVRCQLYRDYFRTHLS